MGVRVLDTERVLDYADYWRRLAQRWAQMAGNETSPHAERLRHAAQMALFAAHEAEQLVRSRVAGGCVPMPVIHSAPEPTRVRGGTRRHGPLRLSTMPGPVALAGQRPRSGPYSGRRTSRLG